MSLFEKIEVRIQILRCSLTRRHTQSKLEWVDTYLMRLTEHVEGQEQPSQPKRVNDRVEVVSEMEEILELVEFSELNVLENARMY